jgi:hypothetical protein
MIKYIVSYLSSGRCELCEFDTESDAKKWIEQAKIINKKRAAIHLRDTEYFITKKELSAHELSIRARVQVYGYM